MCTHFHSSEKVHSFEYSYKSVSLNFFFLRDKCYFAKCRLGNTSFGGPSLAVSEYFVTGNGICQRPSG